MKIMISGIVPGRSLGTAAAVAALLSVAAFSSATPARAEEDTNMFNSMLGFFGMQFDKEQEFDRLPGAAAARRSAQRKFAAAKSGGPQCGLAE